jgi:predicted CXXCH cytochrome family protein
VKRIRKSTWILFLMVWILNASDQSNASPLEELAQSRHNLLVPSLSPSNSCTVCHTDAVPWQATDKKEPEASAAPETDAAKIPSPKRETAPPLWVSKGAKPYNITANLSHEKQPYNHPTGSSFTCLACHDGALGKDMHGINVDQPRLGAEANVPWNGTVGQRGAPPLSRVDHPISIPYPRKPNGRFVPESPTVTLSRYWTLPDQHADGLTLPTAGTSSYLDLPTENVSSPEVLSGLVRTTSGMVQCDSCHNPHSEKIRPFLRVPSATLCLVCHDR